VSSSSQVKLVIFMHHRKLKFPLFLNYLLKLNVNMKTNTAIHEIKLGELEFFLKLLETI